MGFFHSTKKMDMATKSNTEISSKALFSGTFQTMKQEQTHNPMTDQSQCEIREYITMVLSPAHLAP